MSAAEAIEPNIHAGATHLSLLGERLVAHPGGVLIWPAKSTLVVADLHLEKGSSFARKGVFLPPYDSRATLVRLKKLVERIEPAQIIALGDSFHDREGADRLCSEDRALLTSMQQGRNWIWVAGNHDPLPPEELGGSACQEIAIGPLLFRHEPMVGASGEIAGHLHPCSKIKGRARSVRRPCFIEDGMRIILPAFGSLTGGLNVRDDAFSNLFPAKQNVRIHMLGDERVYNLDFSGCRPDAKQLNADVKMA